MKTTLLALSILCAFCLSSAIAEEKSYQVTGPVLEMNDSMIAVQKGKERWEIARAADTKMTGDVKTGDKVTIQYKMTATSVEVKPAKKAKADASSSPAAAASASPAAKAKKK
jgi:ribosomal 50S subunit-recycling heat shock protein